jgi:hypothetical protein
LEEWSYGYMQSNIGKLFSDSDTSVDFVITVFMVVYILPFITYDLLYCLKRSSTTIQYLIGGDKHSAIALSRKRKAYAGRKFGKKELPVSRWND